VSNIESDKLKYSTYIHKDVVEAIRNLAHAKKVSAGYVIEAAIKKCIPEKYFPESSA
jgi:hypothetical protein